MLRTTNYRCQRAAPLPLVLPLTLNRSACGSNTQRAHAPQQPPTPQPPQCRLRKCHEPARPHRCHLGSLNLDASRTRKHKTWLQEFPARPCRLRPTAATPTCRVGHLLTTRSRRAPIRAPCRATCVPPQGLRPGGRSPGLPDPFRPPPLPPSLHNPTLPHSVRPLRAVRRGSRGAARALRRARRVLRLLGAGCWQANEACIEASRLPA